MHMNHVPTMRLIELIKVLEDSTAFASSVDSYLALDDPAAPLLLNEINEAILDLDGIIPVFTRFEYERYLGFSRYEVLGNMIVRPGGYCRATHYYIPTCKGRIKFPDHYRTQVLRALIKTDVTMKYKKAS